MTRRRSWFGCLTHSPYNTLQQRNAVNRARKVPLQCSIRIYLDLLLERTHRQYPVRITSHELRAAGEGRSLRYFHRNTIFGYITFRPLFAGRIIVVIAPFRSLPRNSAPWLSHSQNEAQVQERLLGGRSRGNRRNSSTSSIHTQRGYHRSVLGSG